MSEGLKNAIKGAAARAASVSADSGVKAPAETTTGPDVSHGGGQQQFAGKPPVAPAQAAPANVDTSKKEETDQKKPAQENAEPSNEERLSSLLSIMSEDDGADDGEPSGEETEEPKGEGDGEGDGEGEPSSEKTAELGVGEKGYKALAAMRVKNKEMAAEIERLKTAGISKEKEDRLAELEEIVQKTNYQKSSKFIREHREPLRAAITEAEETAKEFGAKPEIVRATIGMPLGKMLEVLKKSLPDPEARAIMLESMKNCSRLARNADAALAEAKKNYKSAMEEEESNITSQLNKTRDELFAKSLQELREDKAVGFILERFSGDTEDVKKYNGIVAAREERAKKVLFSNDAAQQVKFMVRGAVADDMIGMAKKWYDRATKAERRLADIQKRKPGIGSASGEIKAPVKGGTLRDIARGVAEGMVSKKRK